MRCLIGMHKIKIDQKRWHSCYSMYSARKLPPVSSTSQAGFERLPSLVPIWQTLNDLLPNKQQGGLTGWLFWRHSRAAWRSMNLHALLSWIPCGQSSATRPMPGKALAQTLEWPCCYHGPTFFPFWHSEGKILFCCSLEDVVAECKSIHFTNITMQLANFIIGDFGNIFDIVYFTQFLRLFLPCSIMSRAYTE